MLKNAETMHMNTEFTNIHYSICITTFLSVTLSDSTNRQMLATSVRASMLTMTPQSIHVVTETSFSNLHTEHVFLSTVY